MLRNFEMNALCLDTRQKTDCQQPDKCWVQKFAHFCTLICTTLCTLQMTLATDFSDQPAVCLTSLSNSASCVSCAALRLLNQINQTIVAIVEIRELAVTKCQCFQYSVLCPSKP